MKRNEGFRADDIHRGETPDKNRKKNINRGEEETNIEEERRRKQERGTEHDKEDIERQPK
ncbi:MAG: hypothetical protein R6W90_00940 [Ignavibacteriaceae bacterium]